MRKTSALLATALAAVCWSLNAAATPIVIDYQNFANGQRNGQIAGTRSASVNAGQFEFDVITEGVYWSETLLAFCIDVTKNLVKTTSTYNFLSADNYLNAGQLGLIGQLYNQRSSELGNADNDAAFQLALWEILYDYDRPTLTLDNEAGAGFMASGFGNARGIAETWLSGLAGPSSGYEFFVLTPHQSQLANQALLVARRIEVSEPATLALLGFGILAVGAFKRRPKIALSSDQLTRTLLMRDGYY